MAKQDSTYRTRVYRERGGARFVIDEGGEINFGTGSKTTRKFVNATTSLTLSASQSGTHYLNAAISTIYTLPAASSAGNGVSFRINTASAGHSATAGSINWKLRPQAADKVYGIIAGATDSEVVQQIGTGGAVVGDGVEVQSDGTNWHITNFTGLLASYQRAAAT